MMKYFKNKPLHNVKYIIKNFFIKIKHYNEALYNLIGTSYELILDILLINNRLKIFIVD